MQLGCFQTCYVTEGNLELLVLLLLPLKVSDDSSTPSFLV